MVRLRTWGSQRSDSLESSPTSAPSMSIFNRSMELKPPFHQRWNIPRFDDVCRSVAGPSFAYLSVRFILAPHDGQLRAVLPHTAPYNSGAVTVRLQICVQESVIVRICLDGHDL